VKLKEIVAISTARVFERRETFSEKKRQFVVDNQRIGRLVGINAVEHTENICNNIYYYTFGITIALLL
jgi:hypothetical protein